MHLDVKKFINEYQIFEQDQIQQVQLQHRIALVKAFSIQKGIRILEIGCGQGDTTVALADAVGQDGHIIAIDIASGNYGAPYTLSQAHERIKNSSLGKRISFHLETDFLNVKLTEPIDAIVLSHCSWYFKSKQQLSRYFEQMYQISPRIYFADWDMNMTDFTQRAHFCAASIVALYSSYIQNEGNIQNIFSKEQIKQIAANAKYNLVSEQIVNASFLQDGSWEKGYANQIAEQFIKAPESIQSLVSSYYEVMNSVEEVKSLNSYVLTFEKVKN